LERFVFRLENVLKLRKKIEEGVQLEFSKKRAELVRVDLEIDGSRDTLTNFVNENLRMEGTFSASEILAVDNYIHRVRGRIRQLRDLRREKEDEVNSALGVLKDARKSRKVIENLKERKYKKYLEQLNKEENNDIDDITQNIGTKIEKLTIEDIVLEDM
jgi:flagellar export protein FliJ